MKNARRLAAGLMLVGLMGCSALGQPTVDDLDVTLAILSLEEEMPSSCDLFYNLTIADPGVPLELVAAGTRLETPLCSEALSGSGGFVLIQSSGVAVGTVTNTWSDPRGGTQWAADSGGVVAPSRTWYLPETSTHGGFRSSILVQNPGADSAEVSLSYTTPAGLLEGPQFSLDGGGWKRVDVADSAPNEPSLFPSVTSSSPVLAQVSTSWNEGLSTTRSMGHEAASTKWYLPDGNTAEWSGFETWIAVQNPGEMPAQIQVDYMTDGGMHAGPAFELGPMSQHRFNVADGFPDQPHVSAIVTSNEPVIATQSMHWAGSKGYDQMVGVPAASDQWIFPNARPAESFSSWLAIQNVGDDSASVTVSYLGEDGLLDDLVLELDPLKHESISLPENLPPYGVQVTSSVPILAQQGQYWTCGDDVHRDVQFGVPQLSTQWYDDPGFMMGP